MAAYQTTARQTPRDSANPAVVHNAGGYVQGQQVDTLPQPDSRKQQIRALLEEPESSQPAKMVHFFLICLILGSTASTIVETMPEMRDEAELFFVLEMWITALFTLEFSLRLYACDSLKAFATNVFNWIDFLAIFPGFVELLLPFFLDEKDQGGLVGNNVHRAVGSMRTLRMIRIFRLLRVIRVMRLAKMARHSQLLNAVLKVLKVGGLADSGLLIFVTLMAASVVVVASLIYVVESFQCQTEACSDEMNFNSIPASFWWAVITLTTVGYGDMVPTSNLGKTVGGFSCVCGVVIVSIGVALISMNFRDNWEEERSKDKDRRRSTSGVEIAERSEIENALKNFQDGAQNLLEKLGDSSMQIEMQHPLAKCSTVPMMKSLNERFVSLNKELHSYVYDALLVELRSVSSAQPKRRKSKTDIPARCGDGYVRLPADSRDTHDTDNTKGEKRRNSSTVHFTPR